MNHPDLTLRPLEYSSLRAEVIQSRQYVFERPILIITAAGVVAVPLVGTPAIHVLPMLFVFVLLVNLRFTVSRLTSIARIVAYIDVVLESDQDRLWIGWERALRKYRVWVNSQPSASRQQAMEVHINPSAVPHALMFYPPTYWLHVALVIIMLTVSGLSMIGAADNLPVAGFLGALGTSAMFAFYAVGRFRPAQLKGQIEEQRAIWLAVFAASESELQKTDD